LQVDIAIDITIGIVMVREAEEEEKKTLLEGIPL